VSIYLGNAYASADASYDRACIDDAAEEAMCQQMVSDWEEGYFILGHDASAALAVWGSLEKAAEQLAGKYYRALKVEAASRWVD